MGGLRHYHVREMEKAFAFSQAIEAGDILYLSGHLSLNAAGSVLAPGDMAAQIDNIYKEIGETLAAHGLDFAAVVKETVFTTDMSALVAAAGHRKRFFDGLPGPTATWVEVTRLVHEGALLEVEMIAVRN